MKNHNQQKRDDNEGEIVAAIRGIGAFVHRMNWLDLLIGYKGYWFVFEVKMPNKGKLNPKQEEKVLDVRNKTKVFVVQTGEEAVKILKEEVERLDRTT